MKLIMENWRKFSNLSEQANTQLITRLQDLRASAARQERWDVVDACHDLLEKDGPYFNRFGKRLQSAFASSGPGEFLEVAVGEVKACAKDLNADRDNDGIPDKIELSRQG